VRPAKPTHGLKPFSWTCCGLVLEVPKRSVDKIITILELEGRIEQGVLKRSTLQRHLYKAEYGSMHLEAYSKARECSSKRFCKPNKMMLIQGDTQNGLVIRV